MSNSPHLPDVITSRLYASVTRRLIWVKNESTIGRTTFTTWIATTCNYQIGVDDKTHVAMVGPRNRPLADVQTFGSLAKALNSIGWEVK